MYGKKSETKFTIQFSRTDPAHLHVAGILNQLERYGKAQYIVDAVMHYISSGASGGTQDVQRAARPAAIDERYIEEVVNRIILNRQKREADRPASPYNIPASPYNRPANPNNRSAPDGEDLLNPPQPEKTTLDNDIDMLDSDIETLGNDGFAAITNALDMFRKK